MRKELIKTRAYAIFSEEIRRHLAYIIQKLSDNEKLDEKFCADARIIFHTIKGGSGFFGLEAISDKTARLESLFMEGLDKVTLNMDELKSIISGLEGDVAKLPKPEFDLESNNA